jgi:hypothetical protein
MKLVQLDSWPDIKGDSIWLEAIMEAFTANLNVLEGFLTSDNPESIGYVADDSVMELAEDINLLTQMSEELLAVLVPRESNSSQFLHTQAHKRPRKKHKKADGWEDYWEDIHKNMKKRDTGPLEHLYVLNSGSQSVNPPPHPSLQRFEEELNQDLESYHPDDEGLPLGYSRAQIYKTWYRAMRDFSGIVFKDKETRKKALTSLADPVNYQIDDHYFDGIWADALLQGLLWRRSEGFLQPVSPQTQQSPTLPSPSWTWIDVLGQVEYPTVQGTLKPRIVSSNVAKFDWRHMLTEKLTFRSLKIWARSSRTEKLGKKSRILFDSKDLHDRWNKGESCTCILMTSCLYDVGADWVGLLLHEGEKASQRVGFVVVHEDDLLSFGQPQPFVLE